MDRSGQQGNLKTQLRAPLGYKVLNGMFVLFMAAAFILVLFINQQAVFSFPWFLQAAASLLLALLIYAVLHLLSSLAEIPKMAERIAVPVFIVLLFSLYLFIGWRLMVKPGFDEGFGNVYTLAEGYVQNGETAGNYFAYYPLQRGLYAFYISFFKLLQSLGVSSFLFPGVVLNSIAMCGGAVLVYFTGRACFGKTKALFLLFLYGCSLPLLLNIPLLSGAGISLPFFAGVAFLWTRMREFWRNGQHKKVLPMFCWCSLLAGVGGLINITLLLFWLAVALDLLLLLRGKGRTAVLLPGLAVVLVAFMGLNLALSTSEMFLSDTQPPDKGVPLAHWVAAGLSDNSSLYGQDMQETIQRAPDTRASYNIEKIKARFDSMGAGGFFAHLGNKISYLFGNGSYQALEQIENETGSTFSRLGFVSFVLQLALLLLLVAGAVKIFLTGSDYFSFIRVATVLVYIFLLLWPSQPQNILGMVPLFLLCAVEAGSFSATQKKLPYGQYADRVLTGQTPQTATDKTGDVFEAHTSNGESQKPETGFEEIQEDGPPKINIEETAFPAEDDGIAKKHGFLKRQPIPEKGDGVDIMYSNKEMNLFQQDDIFEQENDKQPQFAEDLGTGPVENIYPPDTGEEDGISLKFISEEPGTAPSLWDLADEEPVDGQEYYPEADPLQENTAETLWAAPQEAYAPPFAEPPPPNDAAQPEEYAPQSPWDEPASYPPHEETSAFSWDPTNPEMLLQREQEPIAPVPADGERPDFTLLQPEGRQVPEESGDLFNEAVPHTPPTALPSKQVWYQGPDYEELPQEEAGGIPENWGVEEPFPAENASFETAYAPAEETMPPLPDEQFFPTPQEENEYFQPQGSEGGVYEAPAPGVQEPPYWQAGVQAQAPGISALQPPVEEPAPPYNTGGDSASFYNTPSFDMGGMPPQAIQPAEPLYFQPEQVQHPAIDQPVVYGGTFPSQQQNFNVGAIQQPAEAVQPLPAYTPVMPQPQAPFSAVPPVQPGVAGGTPQGEEAAGGYPTAQEEAVQPQSAVSYKRYTQPSLDLPMITTKEPPAPSRTQDTGPDAAAAGADTSRQEEEQEYVRKTKRQPRPPLRRAAYLPHTDKEDEK